MYEDGGAAGCWKEDPDVGMENPLEMVLLQPFLVKRHSAVLFSRRNAARAPLQRRVESLAFQLRDWVGFWGEEEKLRPW